MKHESFLNRYIVIVGIAVVIACMVLLVVACTDNDTLGNGCTTTTEDISTMYEGSMQIREHTGASLVKLFEESGAMLEDTSTEGLLVIQYALQETLRVHDNFLDKYPTVHEMLEGCTDDRVQYILDTEEYLMQSKIKALVLGLQLETELDNRS